ncbi:hypothetical protein [Streptomyces sp. MST-110588]|uniref:DUF7224 domain-containing protein n=1 Tax=Streptomyces sp. MST-110588 TaxID=2833628 RepID=UPI001F5D39A0|nr:hypothetical protein [Streptomyces sp. MST-110588]UNO42414.1 hypothetical protein KGS77_26445 [Streptomyces sp. MST-110588]
MTGYLIELRRRFVLLLGALTFLAVAVMLAVALGTWRGLWMETATAVTKAALVAYPVGAAAAAHRASRGRRLGGDRTAEVAARPLPQAHGARLAALLTAVTGGYVTAAAGAYLLSAASGATGHPWLSYPVFSALGLIAVTALGYGVGALLSSRFTAAAVGLTTFVALLFSKDTIWAYAVPNGWPGKVLDPTQTWARLVIVLGLCALAVAVACLRRPGWLARPRTLLAVAALLTVTGLAVANSAGPLLTAREPARPVCRKVDAHSEVCVWPEHVPYLADLTADTRRINAALSRTLTPPRTYVEEGLTPNDAMGFVPGYGRDALRANLAGLALPTFRTCPKESDNALDRRLRATDHLTAWLAARSADARTVPGAVTYDQDAELRATVNKVLRTTEAEQARRVKQWLRQQEAPC